MPGTLVRDANATNILTGATLGSAATSSGTAVQIDKPGYAFIELATGTVASTGNSATLTAEVFGADDSGMTTNKVSLGRFSILTGTDAAQSSVKHYLVVNLYKKYVQTTITTGGTAPVYTGTTMKIVPPHFQQVAQTTTA
jgi:hypothetical protein